MIQLKELRTKGTFSRETLSPQLQLLINIALAQQRQAVALEETNKRVDNLWDVVSLDSSSWWEDSKKLIGKIAYASEGTRPCEKSTVRFTMF